MKAATRSSAVIIGPVSFARFRDEVLLANGSKSKDTIRRTREALDLLSNLGVKTTNDLTPELLDQVAPELEGKSSIAVLKAFWQLNALCNVAESMGYLERSPFPSRPNLMRTMRDAARKIRRTSQITPDQFKRTLAELAAIAESDNLARRCYTMAAVIGYTGLMPAMMGFIRVVDVDFAGHTIRVSRPTGQKVLERFVPMPIELALILDSWLNSRGHHSGRKLDETKVAEAKRLQAEGWTVIDLAARYDIKHVAMYNALAGRTWKNVEDSKEPSSPIGDSEWLFPNLNPSPGRRITGPGKMSCRDQLSYNILKTGGRVAGIDNLTFMDLRLFHQSQYEARSLNSEQSKPPPQLIEEGIELGSWIIMGVKQQTLQKRPQRKVVAAIYGAWREGERLSLRELEDINGDARKILKELKKLDGQLWREIVDMPEKEGNRGRGYGLKDPRLLI